MTAPRTCRACGARLQGTVMWCLRCYEPVRQLTPREPPLPPVPTVSTPPVARPRSRWKAGATTFGPGGRIAITLIVLLLAPTSLNLVLLVTAWPCYLALAVLVLRSTWASDYVDAPDVGSHTEPGAVSASAFERPEPVRIPIPRSTIVAWGLLVALGLGVGIAFLTAGSVGKGLIGISASLGALVLFVRWAVRP